MLNTIKDIINRKRDYMEAADIIFEDGSGNLDDVIVLGETSSEDLEPQLEGDEKDDTTSEDEPKDVENSEDDTPAAKPDEEPVTEPEDDTSDDGSDILDDNDEGPAEEPVPETYDVLDSDSDETPLPLPGDDSLPDVLGKQTGEPPVTDTEDLLDVQINPATGTLKDVLPVPPNNADDVIAGDSLEQHVDSGFGGEEPPAPEAPVAPEPEETPAPETPAEEPIPNTDDLGDPDIPTLDSENPDEGDTLDEPAEGENEQPGGPAANDEEGDDLLDDDSETGGIGESAEPEDHPSDKPEEDKQKEYAQQYRKLVESKMIDAVATSFQQFVEAISLGGDATSKDDSSTDAANTDTPPTDAPGADQTPTDQPVDDGTAGTEDTPADDSTAQENDVTAAVRDKVAEADAPSEQDPAEAKNDLLKRLGQLTKNIEDTKRAVMDAMP